MTELKPCPFCGVPENEDTTDFEHHKDSCYLKLIMLNVYKASANALHGANFTLIPERNIREAWNTRAERTCHPVEKFTEDSPWPVMVCSECGRQLHYDERREMSYQPYCGCGAKVVE